MGVGIEVIGCTQNEIKSQEFERYLSRYGIRYSRTDKDNFYDMRALTKLLSETQEKHNLSRVYAIKEESKLLRNNNIIREVGYEVHLVQIQHVSVFQVSYMGPVRRLDSKGKERITIELLTKEYRHVIDGYIDITQKCDSDLVFGWDDVFITEGNNMSYQQMLKLGYDKISSRDKCMSQFVDDFIVYPKIKTFGNITIPNPKRPVDFNPELSVLQHFKNLSEYFMNEMMIKSRFINVFAQTALNGTFIRAYKNRAQKNYWCPGLNSGLPVIQKKDDFMHELVYHVHDICHNLAPDLLVDGNNSELHKLVYVSARLMSECVTLVLADMIFVDLLFKAGFKYESAPKRQIYQIFQEMKIDLLDDSTRSKTIKKLLYGSYRYCFYGDDQLWCEMIQDAGGDISVLTAYKEKYTNFFMADFNWTNKNWENMTKTEKSRDSFKRWSDTINDYGGKRLSFTTTSHVIESLKLDNNTPMEKILDGIFEWFIEENYMPVFYCIPITDINSVYNNSCHNHAFVRWIFGQMKIMFDNPDVNSERTLSTILRTIKQYSLIGSDAPLDKDVVNGIRRLFESYLERLHKANRITKSELESYKDIYPIFSPIYLTDYDSATVQQTFSRMIGTDEVKDMTAGDCMKEFVKASLC